MGKYVPDLQHAAATSEANFIKLQRIFPNLEEESERMLVLYLQDELVGRAKFTVIERFSYTTTIKLQFKNRQLPEQVFFIRVYSDANMAEVVISEEGRQLDGVYGYPNQNMYQKDEKNQLNQLLSEALTQCMANGVLAIEALQV